jgi:hypothetical protein
MAGAFVTGQLVENTDTSGSTDPFTATLTSVTAGNFLIIAVMWSSGDGSNAISSVTDDSGDTVNTAVQANIGASSGVNSELYYVENASSGTHVISVDYSTISGAYTSIAVAEYSGIVTSSSLDQTNGATDTSGSDNNIATGNITTTDTTTIFATVTHDTYPQDPTISSSITGHTERAEQNDTETMPYSLIEVVGQSTATYGNTYTFGNNSTNQAAVIAAFFEESGGAATPNLLTLLGVG